MKCTNLRISMINLNQYFPTETHFGMLSWSKNFLRF